MVKVIVAAIICIFLPITMYSQDSTLSIVEYQKINKSAFVGCSVDEILSAIRENYETYTCIQTNRWYWLDGIVFTYSLNDSLDINLYVRVKDYRYLKQYQKPAIWNLDSFRMETIHRIDFEVQQKVSGEPVLNRKVLSEILRGERERRADSMSSNNKYSMDVAWKKIRKMKEERPEIFEAVRTLFKFQEDDPDTFRAIIQMLEFVDEYIN